MSKKKVVLAYSGGLDTSFCIPWLSRENNCEVHAITVNTGGFSWLALPDYLRGDFLKTPKFEFH